uniref:Uncharacterized protein n=1 Tax=Cacopsylla melanoneura TaxID=428564 RepID=A0A8D8Z055_9HEMI
MERGKPLTLIIVTRVQVYGRACPNLFPSSCSNHGRATSTSKPLQFTSFHLDSIQEARLKIFRKMTREETPQNLIIKKYFDRLIRCVKTMDITRQIRLLVLRESFLQHEHRPYTHTVIITIHWRECPTPIR